MSTSASKAPGDLTSWGTEVWVGCVNPWDCDRMGHLNTRFYSAYFRRGSEMLATLFGLTGAFAPDAPTTLLVREQNTRFMKEARVGAPLMLRAGVIEMGEQDALFGALLLHGDGSIAASAVIRLDHVDSGDHRGIAWPAGMRERATAFTVTMPEPARARGVPPFEPTEGLSLPTARSLGMRRIGIGVFGPEACDVFGRMRIEQMIALVSDGIGTLVDPIHQIVSASATEPVARTGGAVLEQRAIHLAWPRIGDAFELRSGLVAVEGKVIRLVHWLLDPVSDRIWATLDIVSVTLDLDRRRAVEISAAAHQGLEAHRIGANR